MRTQIWYAVAVLIIVAVVFQFLLRYQYLHPKSGGVVRIDRLTATACYLPCTPAPGGTK